MVRKFLNKGSRQKQKELLTLELVEIEEIAEKLFRKLDKKAKALKAVEARADVKIQELEKLLVRVENLDVPADSGHRYREVSILVKKGLKVDAIASILDMPRGEVELILNIDRR